MIITCNKCNKSFNVDSNLIPDQGRLLECSGCKNKWFFKKNLSSDNHDKTEINDLSKRNIPENNDEKKSEIIIKKIDDIVNKIVPNQIDDSNIDNPNQNNDKNYKTKKNVNILNYIIVFIISFTAFIVLIDTFQRPISAIVPNVEFILYNLYETIKDISLFFKDLI